MKIFKYMALALFGLGLSATAAEKTTHVYPTMGSIERLDPAVNALLALEARIEKLSEGFDWSEGPVWVKKGDYLLFSDVPQNIVYQWKDGEPTSKTSTFMYPSGYTGSKPRAGEPGSNGLTLDNEGRLVLAQHGDRQIGRREKDGNVTALARYYQYRRFNSPNDLVYNKKGDLYFTDPPYGLEKNVDDPAKEIIFQGVYRLAKDAKVDLLTRDLSRPNGIAFSPDESKLYVAVSDPKACHIWSFNVKKDGLLESGRIFFDATHLLPGRKGLPDGLKVDVKGNLWATGPGGVLIITPEGKHIGTIATGEATANCAWGEDGSVLYICADMYLCRVKTLTKGPIPGR